MQTFNHVGLKEALKERHEILDVVSKYFRNQENLRRCVFV